MSEAFTEDRGGGGGVPDLLTKLTVFVSLPTDGVDGCLWGSESSETKQQKQQKSYL